MQCVYPYYYGRASASRGSKVVGNYLIAKIIRVIMYAKLLSMACYMQPPLSATSFTLGDPRLCKIQASPFPVPAMDYERSTSMCPEEK